MHFEDRTTIQTSRRTVWHVSGCSRVRQLDDEHRRSASRALALTLLLTVSSAAAITGQTATLRAGFESNFESSGDELESASNHRLLEGWADLGAAGAEPVHLDEIAVASNYRALLKQLKAGSLDLVLARQPIDDDVSSRAGVEAVLVGRKGESFIVHPQNPVRELTTAQLFRIFTGTTKSWDELGGPQARILIVMNDSGNTARHFQRQLLRGRPFARKRHLVESNQGVVEAVAGSPLAIGFTSLTRAVRAQGLVQLVRLQARSGEVERDGEIRATYAISRPLVLYVRTSRRLAVERFLEVALSDAGQRLLWEADYVPLRQLDEADGL